MKNKEIKVGATVNFNLNKIGGKDFIGTGKIVNEYPDACGCIAVRITAPVSYQSWDGRKTYKAQIGTILSISPKDFI